MSVERGEDGETRLLLESPSTTYHAFDRARVERDTVAVREGVVVTRAIAPGPWKFIGGALGWAIDLALVTAFLGAPRGE
ncbi:MAG: hypothetical protein IT349_12230 [Candidatus Eisenbacteria bacterium]|nr:hypothetical protein [Candidatus Eisenbacteria bacterium]